MTASALSMPTTSKIITHGIELQNALHAALRIAANKTPHDVLQLRISESTGELQIFARDASLDLAMGFTVTTTLVDIIGDRDEVIEITKSDARALAAMKVKRDDAEDEPLVGLIIGENAITRTDETGLGLGIRRATVRRTTWPGETLALGNVEEMLRTAADSLPGETTEFTPAQLKKLGAASACLDTGFKVQPLETTEGFTSRALIVGDLAIGFAALPKKDTPAPEEAPAEGNNPERSLSFEEFDEDEDPYDGSYDADDLEATDLTPHIEAMRKAAGDAAEHVKGLRIVRADPPKGVS